MYNGQRTDNSNISKPSSGNNANGDHKDGPRSANTDARHNQPSALSHPTPKSDQRRKPTRQQLPRALVTPPQVLQQPIPCAPPLLIAEQEGWMNERDPKVLTAPPFPIELTSDPSTAHRPFLLRRKRSHP